MTDADGAIARDWASNKARIADIRRPFATQQGNPPILGSGEHMGGWVAPTRYDRPDDPLRAEKERLDGGAPLWYSPLNMASRQRHVMSHMRSLAGFSDGPITLDVDLGEFGSATFTWQGGEETEGWIMGPLKPVKMGR